MNAKQAIQIITQAAPPLLIGVGIYYGLRWLFSADDKEKKPKTAPANTGMKHCRKETEAFVFRPVPAEIPAKPAAASVPVVIPAFSVASVPKVPMTQAPPLGQIKRKFITREEMIKVFSGDTHGLTRKSAVTALKALGFGKTAAYDALSPDGRFSTWLRLAPDGIISWKS